MHRKHVPAMGNRYWAALTLVSIFGANLGDFAARDLHLGHALGLAPMAVMLAAVFIVERRDQSWNQMYYWIAIIIVRAAATNLGDLLASDLKLGRPLAAALLTVLLAVVLLLGGSYAGRDGTADLKAPTELPRTGVDYWIAMLVAGTLGTVLGDYASFGLGLGTRYASLLLDILLAVVLWLGGVRLFAITAYYWFAIVVVRTAGTAMGDYLAGKEVGIGLEMSTVLSGLLFVLVAWVWKDEGSRRLRAA